MRTHHLNPRGEVRSRGVLPELNGTTEDSGEYGSASSTENGFVRTEAPPWFIFTATDPFVAGPGRCIACPLLCMLGCSGA